MTHEICKKCRNPYCDGTHYWIQLPDLTKAKTREELEALVQGISGNLYEAPSASDCLKCATAEFWDTYKRILCTFSCAEFDAERAKRKAKLAAMPKAEREAVKKAEIPKCHRCGQPSTDSEYDGLMFKDTALDDLGIGDYCLLCRECNKSVVVLMRQWFKEGKTV